MPLDSSVGLSACRDPASPRMGFLALVVSLVFAANLFEGDTAYMSSGIRNRAGVLAWIRVWVRPNPGVE